MHLGNIECRLEVFQITVQNIAGQKLSTVSVYQMNLNGKLRKKLVGMAHPLPPLKSPLLTDTCNGTSL